MGNMLAPLRLIKGFILWSAIVGNVGNSIASDGGLDPLLRYRSGAEVHGLYEIREDVRKFIDKQNAENKTGWIAGDPDIRAQVPRCAVPLQIEWRQDAGRRSVTVICTRTVKGSSEKSWDMPVPIRAEKARRSALRLAGMASGD